MTFDLRAGGQISNDRNQGAGRFKAVIKMDTEALAEMLREIMEDIVEVGVEAARRRAPVDTGRMKSSITGEARRRGTEIQGVISVGGESGSDSPYWPFVEYGTGLRGQSSRNRGVGETADTADVFAGGYRYDYLSKGYIGQPAQPFMRPAIDDMAMFLRTGGRATRS